MEARRIYPVGTSHKFSIFDLLNNFSNSDYHNGYISRLSDLHVKIGEPVAFRLDDSLSPVEGGAACTAEIVEGLLFPMLNEKQIAQIKEDETADLDTAFYWKERKISFRINVFRDRDGLAFVTRMLPISIPESSILGFPNNDVWKKITQLKQGLVIISGVTGSGKSTTINSLIQEISKVRPCRIITLEDPIEYIHTSSNALISQREIGTNVKSFSQGLRSALREDPDIILLGEMRDPETISLAMTAAETGHLVLSTMHTRDVKNAITRILDSFPPERQNSITTQMSFSLAYIISQKLVPRLDGNGRVPAMEILKITTSIANQIQQNNLSQIYTSMETSTNEGMNTMEHHLSTLYHDGIISEEDALFYANDPKSLNL